VIGMGPVIGFTLIEVVVALAIAGAMVSTIMVVRQRLMQSVQQAERVSQANVVAGNLVADWKTARLTIRPGDDTEGMDQQTGLRWRASCRQEEVESGLFMQSLWVRVFGNHQHGEPLVSLEAWQPIEVK